MAGYVERRQFDGQRTGLLADDVRLVTATVEMPEDLQHGALHAAEDGEHLHMANLDHRPLALAGIGRLLRFKLVMLYRILRRRARAMYMRILFAMRKASDASFDCSGRKRPIAI